MDLFCGAGGASEGYRQAGLEVAVVADNNEVALASHLENHPEAEHYHQNRVTSDIEDLRVAVGGPRAREIPPEMRFEPIAIIVMGEEHFNEYSCVNCEGHWYVKKEDVG